MVRIERLDVNGMLDMSFMNFHTIHIFPPFWQEQLHVINPSAIELLAIIEP